MDSPITAVRRQGMRVGRALSVALNPEGEVLFGDMGPLDMCAEEVRCMLLQMLTCSTPLFHFGKEGHMTPDAVVATD
jgi:hypothetical protein